MKRTLITYIIFAIPFFAFCQNSFDTTQYNQVLYRVNIGGDSLNSADNTHVNWETDTYKNPSAYSNWAVTGNHVYTTDSTITEDVSVPAGTPMEIFQQSRGIETWDVTDMSWKFPVTPGVKTEVRIYLAEIFFSNPGERTFDISIDGNLVENDLDLVKDYGVNVGTVKKYEVTSDGTIDIDFVQQGSQPTVSAIEIFEEKPFSIAGISNISDLTEKVFPNPFNDKIIINSKSSNFYLSDLTGNIIRTSQEASQYQDYKVFNCANLPKGIYFLSIDSKIFKLLKD